jgi:hypothetical protein
MLTGICNICGITKYKFITIPKIGKGVFNTLLNALPLPELHLPLDNPTQSEFIPNGSFNNTGRYSFCGPYTKLQKRLSEGYRGVNDLDQACLQHDMAYNNYSDTPNRNVADRILANASDLIAGNPNTPEEVRRDSQLVSNIMTAKSKFGMGVDIHPSVENLPMRALTNVELERAATTIPNFRGVFMRDALPKKHKSKECGIVNLDSHTGDGTHWVGYYSNKGTNIYFDSYGLDPPTELVDYLGGNILTQTFQLQKPGDVICGHLCLIVIQELSAAEPTTDLEEIYKDIILTIYKYL